MSVNKYSKSMIDAERTASYFGYLKTPLKMLGSWDLFENKRFQIITHVYVGFVLLVLSYMTLALVIYLYAEWEDVISNLEEIAESFPLIVSIAIVVYHTIYRRQFYELLEYMEKNFKYHSAQGLTNMSMHESCKAAKTFWRLYSACTMFSVTMYAITPVIVHLWTKEPMQSWILVDITKSTFFKFLFLFLVTCLSQLYVGLAMGQFGVFVAANSILICGQLDLLCCSLRNAKYTALLQNGVKHSALVAAYADVKYDEEHSYSYNIAEMEESCYHYDEKIHGEANTKTRFDIYSSEYDAATVGALKECALLCQTLKQYTQMFEDYVSPLLVLRVIQVTLYMCSLLYSASLKFESTTVEYLAAVVLDIYIYCYYGNQITIQADRVSAAAYQSCWHTMGVGPRKVLLNIMLANKKPTVIRARKFLPMDLRTFVVIIKTSFSYYTLLVNVNDK